MFEQRASEIAAVLFPSGEPMQPVPRLAAPLIMALMCLETGEIQKAYFWVKHALEQFNDIDMRPDD